MKLEKIVSFLEELAPLLFQEHYDNSGLILGEMDADISGILVCLDADEDAVDLAISQGCQLVLSHHPAIFRGIKSFAGGNAESDIIIKAIKNDLALYGYHTNFDSAADGLAFMLCRILDLDNIRILDERCLPGLGLKYGAGRVGDAVPMSGEAFLDMVKTRLSLNVVRYVGEIPDVVMRVAVYNGAYDDGILGKLKELSPDALVTGDLKYHAARDLLHKGIFTIDAGHYGTEKVFAGEMAKILEERFPELKIVRYTGKDVFTYY